MATLKIAQGDTLSAIAKQQGTSVDALVKANPQITDPNLIIAGQDLNLPQIEAPTSGLAETVQPITPEISVAEGQEELIGGPVIPDLGQTVIDNATSQIQKAIGIDLQEQKTSLQTEIQSLQQSVSESQALLEGELKEDFNRNALHKKLQEQENIKFKESELNNVLNQMNDKQLAFTNGKQALVGESSTMRLLRGKQGLLQDKFNAEMSWLTGKAAIIQGDLGRANDAVKLYFDNAVADRTDRINNLAGLFELDKNDLVKLTDEEKSIAKDQMDLLTDINTRQEEEKDAIRTLMLDDTVAAVWDRAGVDMSMSLDDILTKIQPFVAAEQGRKFDAIHGDGAVDTESGQFGQADFENAGVLGQNTTTGAWEINVSALDNFFTIRGIKDKDKNAIVNAANLVADNLNAGQPLENSGELITDAVAPTGALGFPVGTTAGSAFVQSFKETPATFGKMNQAFLKPFGAIGRFGGQILDETIGKTLFGDDK